MDVNTQQAEPILALEAAIRPQVSQALAGAYRMQHHCRLLDIPQPRWLPQLVAALQAAEAEIDARRHLQHVEGSP